jgi:glycosyl hydrolase family 115 (putative glucuronidase)/glycosyl hydrolase family 115
VSPLKKQDACHGPTSAAENRELGRAGQQGSGKAGAGCSHAETLPPRLQFRLCASTHLTSVPDPAMKILMTCHAPARRPSWFFQLLVALPLASALGCKPMPVASSETGGAEEKPDRAGPAGAAAAPGRDPWHQRQARPERSGPEKYVAFEPGPGRFALVAKAKASPLVVSSSDAAGVLRVVGDLRADIGRVTRVLPEISKDTLPGAAELVLIGTLGKSPLVDGLVSSGKLDVAKIVGRWETSLIQVVDDPLPGVARALVIVGSDPRGTIYGVYDLSKQIGVSPWHYWDDVPATERRALFVLPGRHSQGEPAVKYRGFFINDEDPALGTWARNTFGPAPNPQHENGFNHQLYARVFEVLLRLKGNYLWPAVWSRSLFDDDPQNQALAAEYGVVMGTSHEAPMMRAQDEWNRYGKTDGPYGGTGEFSFVRNPEAIEKYWADGIRRMNGFESIVTLGMRGNGDESMEDAAGIQLMNQIVDVQRGILREVTQKEVTSIPQVWTLYKEVQQYWDDGMRAPDDVTINWCDDNWGNLRELPDQSHPPRAGGYGIYYHFDYVGGGRNYKWNDTTPLANVWEQLHLAYAYGVDRLWMVNVGDLKNDEHPTEFFLDYAWSPEEWPIERLLEWERRWAEAQFGPSHASEIAAVLETYGRLQSRRKPELLNRVISLDPKRDIKTDQDAVVYSDGSPFSLIHYAEAERATAEWQKLEASADRIGKALPGRYRDAYYQLVDYPVKSTANLYELRLAQFKNLLYAAQGRASSVDMADVAEKRLEEDRALSAYYNDKLAGGKWKGFQTQPKIGYGGPYLNSHWQQPQRERGQPMEDFIWPALMRPAPVAQAEMGVAIDGSDKVWPAEQSPAVLPELSPFQTQPSPYIEVYNRGKQAFRYDIETGVPWLRVSPRQGTLDKQVRASVSVDWSRAPRGTTEVPIQVSGPAGSRVQVQAVVKNPALPESGLRGFVESNGYVSIEAEHFDRAINRSPVFWKLLPHIGRTASGMTPFPVTAARQAPGGDSPRLEYDVHLFEAGRLLVWAYLSPRNNVLHTDGLEYAVSIDDAEPQIVNVTTALNGIPMNRSWERNTSDNVNLTSTEHHVDKPGAHVLKFWQVDPTVIVQKLVLDTGGLKPSYLGPPESFRAAAPVVDKAAVAERNSATRK